MLANHALVFFHHVVKASNAIQQHDTVWVQVLELIGSVIEMANETIELSVFIFHKNK